MRDAPDIARLAALVAEPSRARMLAALMDGRAFTASELALEGGVAPSTASGHLGQLADGGFVSLTRQGRHRYFRIASADVAALLEQLMTLEARSAPPRVAAGAAAPLRRARVCYDHLAGEAGVRLLQRLCALGLLVGHDEALTPGPGAGAWCEGLGIDLPRLRAGRRALCRSCLDWSERRPHLAGALGAAVLDRLLAAGLVRRLPAGRALTLSRRAEAFVERPELGF